jgi:hypothetical protein
MLRLQQSPPRFCREDEGARRGVSAREDPAARS